MNQEPRLPQIDPVTFAALNTLDGFIARAPLTRQEHTEANKSLQHIVQTLETLQSAVKQLNNSGHRLPGSSSAAPQTVLPGTSPAAANGDAKPDNGRIVAEIAEEIFRNAK